MKDQEKETNKPMYWWPTKDALEAGHINPDDAYPTITNGEYTRALGQSIPYYASRGITNVLLPFPLMPPEEQKVKFETWLRGRIKRYKKEAEEMYGAGMADNSKSQNDAKAFKTWADSYAEIADELEETLSEYLRHTPKQKEVSPEDVIELMINENGNTYTIIEREAGNKAFLLFGGGSEVTPKELADSFREQGYLPKAPEKEGGNTNTKN